MRLPELHALVPAAEAHDLLAPELDAPRQESLFPDEPEPDVVDWDGEPVEEPPPPLTHAQAVALVEHVLGGDPGGDPGGRTD